jgi:two-component system phosphate regulon sensor histidine kinase PhoR
MSIRRKLFILLFCFSLAVILAAGVFSTVTLQQFFESRTVAELQVETERAEFLLRAGGQNDSSRDAFLRSYIHQGNHRLTLIDSTGKVIFESNLPLEKLSTMENHLQRPEIQAALAAGFGTGKRHSATMDADMLYYAKRLAMPLPAQSGYSATEFVRVSIPLTEMNSVVEQTRERIIFSAAIALILMGFATALISRQSAIPIKIMADAAEKIRSGDLDQRIPVPSRDEFGQLAETLNEMVSTLNNDIKKLKKLERIRSEFLGNVSHELRTPIFAIQGMLETLLNGALEDKQVRRDFVERSLKNALRLNELLGDLIEISRIESGEMKMSFRYFDIKEFLGSITGELDALAHNKGIRLSSNVDPSTPQVLGDKERLKQVMMNLIENAIKYTPSGGEVSVTAAPAGERVRVSVRDTGVGIPAEHHSRIFERFYRVDKDRSRQVGGTGLGLAIVKHIVEAHGSSVRVESEPGTGSTFSFTLTALS